MIRLQLFSRLLHLDTIETHYGLDADLHGIRTALEKIREQRGVKALVLEFDDGYTATIAPRGFVLGGLVDENERTTA